jgi:hypothetical protein
MSLATIRDLLLPGIAACEARVGNRVRGDLKIDDDGSLWLLLFAGERTACLHLASRAQLENGDYKDIFSISVRCAFDVFDQATRKEPA